MKKQIISLLILFTVVYSCEDNALDKSPDGRLTMDDIWVDPIKTEAYLTRVYTHNPSFFNTYGILFELMSGCTDEAVYRNRMTVASNWGTGNLTPANNGLNPYYSNYWRGIRDANIFIANINLSAIESINLKARLKAEAKTLRAYYYFELIKQYGAMPIINEGLTSDYNFASLKRPTFQDNINDIVKDLDEAIAEPEFPIKLTLEVDRRRMTKAVAYAIKSEALLYNASPLWNPDNSIDKWKSAAAASLEAYQALTKEDDYKLFPNYGQYYLYATDIKEKANDRQTIYETYIEWPNRIHLITKNNIPSKPGAQSSGACPSQELVDSYDMKTTGEPPILGYKDEDHLVPIINSVSGYNETKPYVDRDPRFYASIWHNGAQYDNVGGNIHTVQTYVGGADGILPIGTDVEGSTATGYYLRKFIDSKIDIFQPTNATWKKYHFAKILLNFAESQNEVAGPTAGAYAAINAIRKRVEMPPLPKNLTQEQFRERVRKERRVELAFEEDRFWDVRRWKILDKTDKVITGMRITKNGSNFQYSRVVVEKRNAWQDKFLIFPIPLGETAIIPDFDKHQNPGW